MNSFNIEISSRANVETNIGNIYLKGTKTQTGWTWRIKTAEGIEQLPEGTFSSEQNKAIYLTGETVRAIFEKAANGEVDPVFSQLTQHPEIKKFAQELTARSTTARANLQRGVKKASKIGAGLEALEKRGKKGKILEKEYWIEAVSAEHPYDVKELHKEWSESDTKLSFDRWLKKHPLQSVTYLDKKQLQTFHIQIEAGKLLQQGALLTTEDAIFVIDARENLYVGPSEVGKFHHSSFRRGGAILGGGGIWAESGRLVQISNGSGHYQPGREQLINTLKFFKDRGIDLSHTVLLEYTEIGIFAYPSAEKWLESEGRCLPDQFTGEFAVEFISDQNGRLEQISCMEASRSDCLKLLKELSNRGIDLSGVALKQQLRWEDEFIFAANEYLQKKGQVRPVGWEGGKISMKGRTLELLRTKPKEESEYIEILSQIEILNLLKDHGLPLAQAVFRHREDPESTFSADKYLKHLETRQQLFKDQMEQEYPEAA